MRALKVSGLVLVGIVIGALLYAHVPVLYLTSDKEPPLNFVAATERIHTSGQPSAAQIRGLKAAGYDMVINLAPPQTLGSMNQEGGIAGEAGIYYVNIPVDWHNPTYSDFQFFSEILKQSKSRRVLVHCQVNRRASVFTFLYLVIHEGVEPSRAYDNVKMIWEPVPHWIDFSTAVLSKHGIDFELEQ